MSQLIGIYLQLIILTSLKNFGHGTLWLTQHLKMTIFMVRLEKSSKIWFGLSQNYVDHNGAPVMVCDNTDFAM